MQSNLWLSVQAVWSAATTKQSRHSIQAQSELHAEKETLQQHVNKFKGQVANCLLVSGSCLQSEARLQLALDTAQADPTADVRCLRGCCLLGHVWVAGA